MVLERLPSCQCRLLSEIQAGRIVGIVNLGNIMELIEIQTALDKSIEAVICGGLRFVL